MRNIRILAAVLLLTITPAALADSIQLSVSSSVLANISSPNDNFWGTYSTSAPYTDFPSLGGNMKAVADFSSVSLFVPAGNVVTSAAINVILPTPQLHGAGINFPLQAFPPPNSGISIPPTFNGTGSSEVVVNNDPFFFAVPIINGNEVSTGDLVLKFLLVGTIEDSLATPGVNWDGYIGGSGQVDIPYTVELDVTYSPVSEPSTFILLGTGILFLAGAACCKFLFHPSDRKPSIQERAYSLE
jgi:hypothetical protein